MDKNFTQSTIMTSLQSLNTEKPAAETLAKIKQFARVYSFASTSVSSLGGLVLN